MSIFGGDKISREKKALEKKFAKNDKRRANALQRTKQIDSCFAALTECERSFKKTILSERARAEEMQMKGYPIEEERARVREAAIGLLVADRAKYDLRGTPSEQSFNSAVNQLGMALKQLRKLDKSTSAVSSSVKKELQSWYPYPLEENSADQDPLAQMKLPQEMVQRIDKNFISNLMAGDSFETCMAKSVVAKETYGTDTLNDNNAYWDAIKDVADDASSSAGEDLAMERANKF